MTCLSLALRKTLLNLLKKMFQCLGWMRKNFIPGNFSWSVAAETWDASCFKKGLLEKRQNVPNTCTILHWKKYFFRTQQLTDEFFPQQRFFLNFLTPPVPQAGGGACPESSIKTNSLNTEPCPAGLSPSIICQEASPFLPKMSQNCCTHQVWTVPPSPEPLWVTLRMGKILPNSQKVTHFPHQKNPP